MLYCHSDHPLVFISSALHLISTLKHRPAGRKDHVNYPFSNSIPMPHQISRVNSVFLYYTYSVWFSPALFSLSYSGPNVLPAECLSTVRHQPSRVRLFLDEKLTFFHVISTGNTRLLVHYTQSLFPSSTSLPPSLFLSLDPKLTRSLYSRHKCAWSQVQWSCFLARENVTRVVVVRGKSTKLTNNQSASKIEWHSHSGHEHSMISKVAGKTARSCACARRNVLL